MAVTDSSAGNAMVRGKRRFARCLTLCFVAMLVIGMSFAGVAGAQTTSDTLESNDERSTATDVGSGDSYDGLSIHSSDDEDYFAVDVEAGERITADIEFEHSDGDLDMVIQDSTGSTLAGSASVSDDESAEYIAQESGTYYVQVYGFGGDTAEYDVSIDTEEVSGDSLEPNDERSSATDLGTGDSYDDLEISSATDSDYFAVQADAGDTITADIAFSHANGDLDMVLLDADGNALDGSASVSDDENIEYTVTESGTYYVEVYAFSGAPNSYDIDVNTSSSGTDGDQIQDGADLRSISVGESADGTIDTSDPTVEGYYHEPVTFYGESGEALNIEMTSETGDSYLVLQGPDGEYLTFNDDGGDGLDAAIEDYVLPQSGEYTIIATSYSGSSTFNYTLSVEEGEAPEDDDLEPNDDIDSATSLGDGGSYDDLIIADTYGESDYFAVYAQEGQTITADITFSDDDGDLDLEIQDDTGAFLNGSYSVSDDETVTYTAEESGTYYVEVYAFSGAPTDYDIDVSTSGADGEETTTNENLSLNANATATASGNIEVAFDLENTGDDSQAVILQAGDGVESLGSGYSISDRSDDGGTWRSSEGSWLFDDLSGGETVSPTATVDVPEGADGTRLMTVSAESDSGTVTTVVEVDLSGIGIAQAADTNDDGELSDTEVLAAIEAWRTDSTIEGTDTYVSDEQIINLVSTWRAEGS